ncbi:hypothetical protein QUF58_00075 [Anaerolineales bacterium HSG24]|nr:hypothetical protein [Anaerolineales bacterium HSG24]
MNRFMTAPKIIIIITLAIGIVVIGYVPLSIASIEDIPITSHINLLGARLVLAPVDDNVASPTLLTEAATVIEHRLAQANLKGQFEVAVQAEYLEIILSEGQDVPYIKPLITRVGEISFIDGGVESAPLGQLSDIEHYQPVLTSQGVKNFERPKNGDIFYTLSLNASFTNKLTDFMAQNPDNYICVAMDGQISNCSSMYHLNADKLMIVPNISGGSALTMAELMTFINSGALPTAFEIVE